MIFSSTVSFVKSSHGVKYGSNLIQVPYRHIPQEKEKIIPMFSKYRIFLPLFILLSFRKMVSVVIFSLHSITVTVFAILLITSTSNGDDLKYKTCSSSFILCGNLTKVGYPFWGYDRPQYCGHPALQLHCIDDSPVLEIGDDGREVYYYLVKNISSSSEKNQMTIRLHEHFPMTCPFHSFNKAFNKIFQLREDQANVTLFYDCRQDMDGYLNCSVPCGEKKSTNYYLERTLHTKTFEICQSIEVPVPSNELQYLYSKTFDILDQGFEVDYRNSSACYNCHNSSGICGSQDAEFACFHRKTGQLNLIAEIAIPGALLLMAAGIGIFIALYYCLRKTGSKLQMSFFWKAQAKKYQNIDAFLQIYGSLAPKRYTYAMIRNMTNGFNERLGEGGYAIVYKGKLINGRLVAVKLLKQSKGNGEDFINEVASICRTNHVNIVSLLGFCFEGKRRALIYDFMSYGSLEKFAYNGAREQALSWETLFSIAVGIAKGLDYLHTGCNARILHFDIKPHNILLDEDFCPKISDFGLARLCPQQESTISTLEMRGTIGYIAPEVFCRTIGSVSHKSDVYSYGMMILDLVCGRKNLIAAEMQRSSELYFPQWMYKRLQQGEEVAIHGTMNDEQTALERKMILVSLWCIQTYPSNRPSMSKVIEMLQGGLELIQLPPDPHLSSPPRMEYCSFETIS